jgi:glycosyltransferase involved in cell wall biosynthesis
MSVLVSICIPAYNAGKYIAETLRSLCGQTYKNIEIIVSDNASTDNTGDIVKKFAENDKKIKYFRNEANVGYVKNIRAAVEKASSETIAIYHADDIYEPEIVEEEIKVLLNNPKMGGVFVKLREFQDSSRIVKRENPFYHFFNKLAFFDKKHECLMGGLDQFLPSLMKHGNFFACPSFMTTKPVFFEAGGFTDKYPSNEDLEFWLKILNKGYSLAIINKTLLNYRRTEGQGSAFWNSSPELPEFYHVMDDFLADVKIPLPESSFIDYRKNKSDGYLTAAYNAFVLNNKPLYYKYIKMSKEVYCFPFYSKKGIYQIMPAVVFRMKKVSFIIRNLLLKLQYKKDTGFGKNI